MSDFYSGTVAGDVQNLMRQVGITLTNQQATLADAIPQDVVERYQAEVDQIVNTTLDAVTEVPLIKVTRKGVTDFPLEIRYVARRLVAAEIILAEYTEVEPNLSEGGKELRERALAQLRRYADGRIGPSNRVDGQRRRLKDRFVRPTSYPQEPTEIT